MAHLSVTTLSTAIFALYSLSNCEISYIKLIEYKVCGNESLCAFVNSTSFNSALGMPPIITQSHCCGDCSCNMTTCGVKGTCCIDTFDKLPTIEESSNRLQMTCQYPQLRPYHINMANAANRVRMLRRCRDTTKLDVLARCEYPEKYDDLFTQLPVLDKDSMFSYQNKFCAKCNGVPEQRLLFWKPNVECKSERYYGTNINTIVQDVKATASCNLVYDTPDEQNPSQLYCKHTFEVCNETGLWKYYNQEIEQACHAYTRLYKGNFKNVFCYLCNIEDFSALARHCTPTPPPFNIPKFSALLVLPDIMNDLSIVTDSCERNQILDPFTSLCVDLHCKFPKTIRDNECVDFVTSIKIVSYDIFIKLKPLSISTVCNSSDGVLGLQTYAIFSTWFTSNIVPESELQLLSVSIDRDSMDKGDESSSERYILVAARIFFGTSTLLSTFNRILELDGKRFSIGSNNSQCDYSAIISHMFHSPKSPTNRITNKTLIPIPIAYKGNVHLKAIEESLTKFYFCPHVILQVKELSLEIRRRDYYVGKYNLTVSFDDIDVVGDSVYMCLETIKELFKNDSTRAASREPTAIHIVSFVLVMVSLMFALCTAFIYGMFKELRTQPGVNNLVLALFTIVSQSLFQFGFNNSEGISEMSCIVLGVLIHYSWCLLLVWMNACSLHMFRVFLGNPNKAANYNAIKTTSCYLAYCASLASIPVLINIGISLLTTNGQQIGYGGQYGAHYCYVTASGFHKFILTVPLAAIILTNVGIYIAVVIKNERTKSCIKGQSGNKCLVLVYVKLSSLTGLTWIFGFVFMFTNQEWAEFVFVILNASQGIYIFAAFVLNGRTWKLCKNAFEKHRKQTKVTGTAHTYLSQRYPTKYGSSDHAVVS